MALVSSYHMLMYGSPAGYQNARAQVSLMNGTQVVGIIRFIDADTAMPMDEQRADGRIYSFMPMHAMPMVIDMLRNEGPINFYFAAGRGFLGTRELEQVGENDI